MKTTPVRVLRWNSGENVLRLDDDLAVEEPLEIRVDTRPVSITMRTPGQDVELAAGFLYSEGVVTAFKDIAAVKADPRNHDGNVVNVFLAPGLTVDLARLARHGFATSSCGLCGKTTIKAVHRRFKPVKSALSVRANIIRSLPERMRRVQEAFARTGGLHAAAIFEPSGRLVVLREDVGRHNAVDKAIGWGFLGGLLPFDRHILMVSGRASFEILQKSLAARIPVVCAVSAPSSLAVQFARRSGQTLIGFLREERMNVYSVGKRLVSGAGH